MLRYVYISVELDLPDWLKKRIVDKQIIIKRCREELTLCIKEMRAYCSFYKEKAISLQSEMKQIDDWITGFHTFLLFIRICIIFRNRAFFMRLYQHNNYCIKQSGESGHYVQ